MHTLAKVTHIQSVIYDRCRGAAICNNCPHCV